MPLDPRFEQQLKNRYGVTELPPLVCFFDHAVEDKEASEASGRPRYRAMVYLEKKPRDGIGRDVFHRAMVETDKKEYAAAWQRYCEKKEVLANRAPPIMALPGMDVAAHAELQAMGLTNSELLANYEGDLGNLAKFKILAKKIMEISNDCLLQRRDDVPVAVQRSVHSQGSMPWTGEVYGVGKTGIIENFQTEKETGQKEENVIFKYEWNVA